VRLFRAFAANYRTLVETGTWQGDGIDTALQAGFAQVVSCDVNGELVEAARRRFTAKPVRVLHSPSEEMLSNVVPMLTEPSVFFLDAHAMPVDVAFAEFSTMTLMKGHESNAGLQCPIEKELSIILNVELAEHVILIDDAQCFGTWMFHGLTEDDVRHQVESISPGKYRFSHYENVFCILPSQAPTPREKMRTRLGREIRALSRRKSRE